MTNYVSGVPFLTNTISNERARRGHFDYENSYIDAKYNLKVGNTSDLDLNIFYDRIRDHAIGDDGGLSPSRYIRSEEDGIGGEVIFTTNYFEDHKIILGTNKSDAHGNEDCEPDKKRSDH